MFLPFEEGFSAQCLFQGSQGLFIRSHRGCVPINWDFMLRLEGMETENRVFQGGVAAVGYSYGCAWDVPCARLRKSSKYRPLIGTEPQNC